MLQIATRADDADLAADRLWQAGARAVEEVALPDDRSGVRTVLADDDAVSTARLGPLPPGWQLGWVEVTDEPAATWRESVAPIAVGDRIVVRPAWLPELADGRIEVAIEPGGAFGLGDHPTTRLTAEAVARLSTPGCSVLDVGCGSGVLAIIAARLGASRVDGIDIAEAAVEATRANAVRNGVDGRVVASSVSIAETDASYDLVLANVLAPAIVSMAADLRRVLAPSGTLIVSGILAEAHDHVIAALDPLVAVRTEALGEWAAVELR